MYLLNFMVDPNHEILKIQRMPPHPYWLWDVDPNNIVVIYGTLSEREANKAAAESLQQDGHYYSSNPIKADTEVTSEDLNAQCLILIGRPAVNQITKQLEDRFPIKFEGEKFTWQGKVYDRETQGVIAVVDEGRSSKKLIILCAGLSDKATRDIRAIDELYIFFDLNRYDQMDSYLIFDKNKWILTGDWELEDPDLIRKF